MAPEDPIRSAADFIRQKLVEAGITSDRFVVVADDENLDEKMDRWLLQRSEQLFITVTIGDDFPIVSETGPNVFDGLYVVTASVQKILRAPGMASISSIAVKIARALNEEREDTANYNQRLRVTRIRLGTAEANVQNSKQEFSFTSVTLKKQITI